MKKLIASAFVIASLASCHHGQDEAKKTLERNEKYKNEETDYSVNRAGEYSYENSTVKKADTSSAAAAEAPAGETHH